VCPRFLPALLCPGCAAAGAGAFLPWSACGVGAGRFPSLGSAGVLGAVPPPLPRPAPGLFCGCRGALCAGFGPGSSRLSFLLLGGVSWSLLLPVRWLSPLSALARCARSWCAAPCAPSPAGWWWPRSPPRPAPVRSLAPGRRGWGARLWSAGPVRSGRCLCLARSRPPASSPVWPLAFPSLAACAAWCASFPSPPSGRGRPVSSPPSPSSALVGFCGSRSLPASWAGLVSSVVASVLGSGRRVAVGCARGADQLVRSAAPGALVFSASAVAASAGLPAGSRASFARRSASLVSAVAASGPGAGFVGFVSSPCQASVRPSSSPGACFCGGGSGSWASLALAAGLGLPVVVFWCVPAGAPVPQVAPPSWGGSWVRAGSGVWASGWRFVPAPRPVQASFL